MDGNMEKTVDINVLMQPMKTEYGRQTAALSKDAARFSLQLASLAYTLDLDAWRADGWQDVSYHIDNKLLSGEAANGTGGLSGMISEYRQFMSRLKAKSTNIINQVMGTVRNREESDTCKAVVMMKKAGPNRYLVAIGFMGTGKRVYDWLANIRIHNEEGMHQGTLQLTRRFEENLQDIIFPQTARELGLEKLTLQDILQECRRTDSRFKIWMAGHSQGGGVMQLFAYRAVSRGVLRSNMIGYGFASPSVLFGNSKMDVQSMPLFHVINEDDLVPRLGARVHVGQCLLYRPTADMRQACYGKVWKSEAYEAAFGLVQRVRHTEDVMALVMALCSALQQLSDEATVQAASELLGRFLPERMVSLLGGQMDQGLQALQRYVERNYRQATGKEELPAGKITVFRNAIMAEMETYGTRVFVKCLLQVMGIPHRLRYQAVHGEAVPAYAYLTDEGFFGLRKGISAQYPSIPYRQAVKRKRPRGRFSYALRREMKAGIR